MNANQIEKLQEQIRVVKQASAAVSRAEKRLEDAEKALDAARNTLAVLAAGGSVDAEPTDSEDEETA